MRPSGERRPLSFLAAASWTIGANLALVVAVQLTEAARPGARADLVNVTACYVLTYSLILFTMLRVYEPETRVREVLAVRRCSFFGAALAVVSGASIYPALSWVDDWMSKRFPTPDEERELIDRLMEAGSRGQRAVIVITFVLIMPLVQELFFRGVLYGGLRRGRVSSLAIVGTAVFFAAANLDPRAFPMLIVLGLLLTWLRSRSGSVIPSTLAHVAFWAVPLAPLVIGRQEVEIYPRTWIIGGAVGALVAALLAGAIFTRDERALTARIEDG
jgi:membrane protease YdiL (CAAX protease family)